MEAVARSGSGINYSGFLTLKLLKELKKLTIDLAIGRWGLVLAGWAGFASHTMGVRAV